MIELAGTWALADAEGEYDVPATVPGDVHSALFAAGRIPDPYVGRNEYGLRWVADRDWALTRAFELRGQGPWTLVIDGLDTIAEVRLNGRLVLEAATSFREHVTPVSEALVPGTNRIEIRLRSNPRAANELQAQQPYYVPYQEVNGPIPNANMLRKPQCDFGWDWNIALAPFGLHGRIALIGAAGEIAAPKITQVHRGDTVEIVVSAMLRGCAALEVPWSVTIGDAHAEGLAPLIAGKGSIDAVLTLADPALWWPAGSGAQPLHEVTIRAGDATRTLRLAVRDIALVTEADAAGLGFKFRVNGRDIFARGANWIPADALPGRITVEKTRALLQSAADAHMNMLRVWGGGRYEPDSFYAACDELGLLVWQDFMFACHLYPATPTFLDEVAREAEFQVTRLSHRVALWCGDNELIGALNWFPESRANRDRYLVAYDRLNRTLEASLKRVLPQANWWPSSPSPGPMSFGDAWHDDSSGDMHFWSVWHEGRDFEHYRDVKPRFCSEFGFQSYPSLNVIESFLDPADMNIASPVMESHQKNPGGNARIAETMFRYFRFPKDFANFVWLSQIQQGLAIKTAVEYWRSLKPHCMGALYWQLNDTWPVASWSGLDYGGDWKLLHHLAHRFYQPVAVAVIPGPEGYRITAVNDTAAPVEVTVELFAAAMDGTTRPVGEAAARVGTDAAMTLTAVPESALNDGEILAFRWRGSNGMAGGDCLPQARYKALDLRDPKLRVEVTPDGANLRARVSAEALALFVTLEADRPGRFSSNAFAVFPGFDPEVTFTPRDGDARGVRITTRDLYSSYAPSQA